MAQFRLFLPAACASDTHCSQTADRERSQPMTSRLARVLAVAILVVGTVAISGLQRNAPAVDDATARAVAAAETYLATLSEAERAKALIDLNEKTRTVWSNLPSGATLQVGAKERNGLKLGAMSPAQEAAAVALLRTVLSADGFTKAMEIVEADQVLENRAASTRPAGAPVRFGRAEYFLAVLGRPSRTRPWMIQFGGHHLAINVTLAGGDHVLAPTHTGTQPASYNIEGRLVRPLGDENDKAFALVNALTPEQQKQAVLGVAVRNLVLGPGADGKTIAPEGVRVSTFTPAQREMLVGLIREWVDILGIAAAAAKMQEVRAGLDATWFAWAGALENGKGAYFRIQGPAVLIEYAPQGQSETSPDHIHTIFRDPTNDYAVRAARP
jgi:hypothetical protein